MTDYLKWDSFTDNASKVIELMNSYIEEISNFPVRSQVKPNEIHQKLKQFGLDNSKLEDLLSYFQKELQPGITNWEHPRFGAYFPSNNSQASVLAEMMMPVFGIQGMLWETSPLATEMEMFVMSTFQKELGLPNQWEGVLHEGASISTLTALICARDRKLESVRKEGLFNQPKLRVYASTQAHNSIDKACIVAGVGLDNLVKIPVDENQAMRADLLEEAIKSDIEKGFVPCMIMGVLGTTSTTAIDPLGEIGSIAKKHKIWHHIDAAYAGWLLLLEDYASLQEDVVDADSFVVNAHKWLFTNFDCTLFYVKSKSELTASMGATAAYLVTEQDEVVNNYKDWGLTLGRRFRSLKLWFLLNLVGIQKIKDVLSFHIDFGKKLKSGIDAIPNLKVWSYHVNTICFQVVDHSGKANKPQTHELLSLINSRGNTYLTPTTVNDENLIRAVYSSTLLEEKHLEEVLSELKKCTEIVTK